MTHKKALIMTVSLPLLVGAAALAQDRPRPPRPPMHGDIGSLAGDLEAKVVTGAPFSAQVVSTSTQTLSDGSHITRNVTATVARDSQGRSFRQQTMNAVGPLSTGASRTVIFLKDPVAQTSHVVSPESKTAVRTEIHRPPPGGGPGRHGEHSAGLPVAVGDSRRGNAVVESLGTQTIEGVLAEGTRTTHTIPAGSIGNDQPIRIVSESWYARDLQTVILSTHSDPRVGESTFKLTGIQRTEPAASLFQVPAGFTVKEPSRRPPGPGGPRPQPAR